MLGDYLGGQGFNGGLVGDIKNMARDFNGVLCEHRNGLCEGCFVDLTGGYVGARLGEEYG